jgi:Spy/CpxP family protein refolding chaperone
MNAGSRFVIIERVAAAVVIVGALGTGDYAQQQQQQQQQNQQPAGPGGGWQGRGMRPGGPMARLGFGLGQLNLTPEQKQQVKSIFQGHQADFRSLAERARPARRALSDAIASGDESAIRQRSTEVGSVQTDRAVLMARVRNEIFKVLTPEQQQKAQALRQQFGQRMDQRRQGGPRKNRFLQ